MRIKNSKLEDFANFLLAMKLGGQDNRMRNRMIKVIQRQLKEVQEEHNLLLDEYCKKNDDGTFKTTEKNGKSYYDIDDVKGFQEEYALLMEEELILPYDEINKPMLNKIRDMVLSCDKEFSGSEAMMYESFCEIVENMESTDEEDDEEMEDIEILEEIKS